MKIHRYRQWGVAILSVCGGTLTSSALAASLNFQALDNNNFQNGTYGTGSQQYQWSTTGDKPQYQDNAFNESTQGSLHGLWLEGSGSFVIDFTTPVPFLKLNFSEIEINESKKYESLTITLTTSSGQTLNLNQAKYLAYQGSNVEHDTGNTWTAKQSATTADEQSLNGRLHFDLGTEAIDRIQVQFLTNSASLRMIEPSWETHVDYGDAPSQYGIVGHKISTVHLGSRAPDADSGSLFSSNANGDGLLDDDGVTLANSSLQGKTLTVGNNYVWNTKVTGNGFLQAWVDWNHDGDFADADEQIAHNKAPSAGYINLTQTIPAHAATGMTFARFRFSNELNLAATGFASTGEVEDYAFFIQPVLDQDGDGLTDVQEATLGTNPRMADTDTDGLNDGDEINKYNTNPTNEDSDGDGLRDGVEVNHYKTNPKMADTDGDGLSDGDEVITHTTNPKQADSDGDGLNDGVEIKTYSTDPKLADSDNDGLNDGAEVNSYSTQPLLADSDNDGLSDAIEIQQTSTNPLLADSDGDTIPDGLEVGSNLSQALDSDNDSIINALDNDDDNDGVLSLYELPRTLDTDNDGIPNHLDSDDDGDKVLTQNEQADPNKDGNPNDAHDLDIDGVPSYLDAQEQAIVLLQAKAFLQGAFDPQTQLMHDTLREQQLIPQTQPYAIQRGTLQHNGTETMHSNALSITGDAAIVDWVIVELRSATDHTQVITRLAALLQRNGQIVMADTLDKNLRLAAEVGSYYLAIRHRNHLGIMSQQAISLSQTTTLADFTNTQATYGTQAQTVNQEGYWMMWAGDNNHDNFIISIGRSNDIASIISTILTHTDNKTSNLGFVETGYHDLDLNMDGRVIAAGSGNDLNLIMANILIHPSNHSVSRNYIIRGTLP